MAVRHSSYLGGFVHGAFCDARNCPGSIANFLLRAQIKNIQLKSLCTFKRIIDPQSLQNPGYNQIMIKIKDIIMREGARALPDWLLPLMTSSTPYRQAFFARTGALFAIHLQGDQTVL